MTKAKWKKPIHQKITKNSKKPVKEKLKRNCEIMPNHINKIFKIHTGKNYNEVTVTKEMIGHKFGEFVFTRAKFIYKKKKIKRYGTKK